MNSIHDLGGMHNMGELQVELDEPVFHHDWERKVFSFALGLLGARYFNLDEIRHAGERMSPVDYLALPYFANWLHGMTTLLVEKDILTREELDAGRSLRPDNGKLVPPFPPEIAGYIMNNPIPTRREEGLVARFKPGDAIVARNINPVGHTRLPRYVRGKRGIVEEDYGKFPFSDSVAHGGPERAQHVYSVCFTARELWGDEASAGDTVSLDLFDDYLEAV